MQISDCLLCVLVLLSLTMHAFNPPCIIAEEKKATELFPQELVRFQQHPINPVFLAGGKNHWDVTMRERGWILKDGETYKLWYTGYNGTREGNQNAGICHFGRWDSLVQTQAESHLQPALD